MKKILIIIPSLKKGGGAERVASLIIEQLSQRYDIFLLTFYNSQNKYATAAREICLDEDVSKNWLKIFYKLFSRSVAINKIAEKNKINTVISFVEDANIPAIISKLILRNKSRLIISTHSNPLTRTALHKILMRIFYGKADVIVTVSRGVMGALEHYFKLPKSKLRTIYNPINLDSIEQELQYEISDNFKPLFSSESFKFISLGRLFKIKNHIGTITAFEKIARRYPSAKLFIIGEGPQRQEIENMIENLRLKNSVFLLGLQENPFPYLLRSDCFVFNSFSEGFGVAIIEALASSLPVISSNCNYGPGEILCNESRDQADDKIKICANGILVPVDNNKMLAEAMELALKDSPTLQKLKNKALERAQSFDITKIILNWIDLIDER